MQSYCTNNAPYCRAALPTRAEEPGAAYGRRCTACHAYYPWSAEHHQMEMHVLTQGGSVGARHLAHCQAGYCAAVAHDQSASYGWHSIASMTVPWPKTMHFCPERAVTGADCCKTHDG